MSRIWLVAGGCALLLALLAYGPGGEEPAPGPGTQRLAHVPAPTARAPAPSEAEPRDEPAGLDRQRSGPAARSQQIARLMALDDRGLADALRRSEEDALRQVMLAELARRGSNETFEAALHLLDDRAAQSRALAADSLADLGDAAAVAPLQRALREESDAEARSSIEIALVRLDPTFEADGRWRQITADLEARESARTGGDALRRLLLEHPRRRRDLAPAGAGEWAPASER